MGRSFYTSLGHRDDIGSADPTYRAHVTGGIRWALGIENRSIAHEETQRMTRMIFWSPDLVF